LRIDPEKCNGCGICVPDCPKDAISLKDKKAVIGEDCVECGACYRVCLGNALIPEIEPIAGAIQCECCPIKCQIKPLQIGACFRYTNQDGKLVRNIPLHSLADVKDIIGKEPDLAIRRPLITAIGAGTTYPDFKPAPHIVQSKVDGVDVVTVVTEAPLSYSGMLIKIDTDEYIGEEGAPVFIDKGEEGVSAPCIEACPVGIDVPRYIRLIGEGKFAEALSVVRERIPFPAVCGRICFHPCEINCLRSQLGGPIAIRALKRFIADQDKGLWKIESGHAEPNGKKVAVVGSGPGGLTAAYYLAKLGHSVTVFEELPVVGGMLRVGIPDYRLPEEIIEPEIRIIREAGVEIRTNTKVGSLDRIFEKGYAAIFLAIGAHKGIRLGIEGEDSPGVMQCLPFLKDVKLGKSIRLQGKVAVIGGGNAAVDAARTALRLGARDVTIVYRRSRAEMPAMGEEVEAALHEGVNIQFLATPARITADNGQLKMQCIQMKLGQSDASSRRRPEPITGSEFDIVASTVIVAIGETPNIPSQFGLKQGNGNTLQVDPDTLRTSRDGVFAGGDDVTGPASVIDAIAAGRKAAISIDRYLGGGGIIEETLAPPQGIDMPLDVFKPAEEKRLAIPLVPVTERLNNFNVVEHGYTEAMAIREAERCLRCDLEGQVRVGHVTTEQYGSKMLSLGGPMLLTKKGGSAIARLMVDIANKKEVALKADGGASMRLQLGKEPSINEEIIEKMRVGCGSACAGIFAQQFLRSADEVIVIDHHITSLFTRHEAGQALGAKYSGLKLKGIESTPGRYFAVAEAGHGWGGTNIDDPLEVIDNIDMGIARPGMRLLITESTGKRAAMYELDIVGDLHQIEITPEAQTTINMISSNCEDSKVSAVFIGGSGGSARKGVTEHPLKLTQAIHENKAKLTVGGSPVYILPGGGINFLVDVSQVKVHAFTWVPTPAVVVPVEITMKLKDYLEIGGHVGSIKTLKALKQHIRKLP
jgi:NADPH-dependent glutamate synthase beta subunit-like oxidoreductase/NAD-dependent dihydropyrimidine dehydrogenase PreA subunit